MTLRIADFHARTVQCANFAVDTARPGLGHLPSHGWRVRSYKLCLTRLPIRRTFVAAIVCFAPIMRGDGESPPKLKVKSPRESLVATTKMLSTLKRSVCKIVPSTREVVNDPVPADFSRSIWNKFARVSFSKS